MYHMIILLLILTLNFLYAWPDEHPTLDQKNMMVDEVNKIRLEGCYCGIKVMTPVGKITWNEKLYQSALNHAKDMNEYHFFGHFSKEGLDIGKRIDLAGYRWLVAGENLGEGQKEFNEVLNDWLKSYTHCKMLMNPKVDEMAIAKYDKYWVQHFGKQAPGQE